MIFFQFPRLTQRQQVILAVLVWAINAVIGGLIKQNWWWVGGCSIMMLVAVLCYVFRKPSEDR